MERFFKRMIQEGEVGAGDIGENSVPIINVIIFKAQNANGCLFSIGSVDDIPELADVDNYRTRQALVEIRVCKQPDLNLPVWIDSAVGAKQHLLGGIQRLRELSHLSLVFTDNGVEVFFGPFLHRSKRDANGA